MRGVPPPEANDAHWLLDFYHSFFTSAAVEEDTSKRALESLSQVGGRHELCEMGFSHTLAAPRFPHACLGLWCRLLLCSQRAPQACTQRGARQVHLAV
jgi:hypothetical protein